MDCHDGELSILFTDDSHIAELNRHYLGREGPTNVLAFPMTCETDQEINRGMLGDIVISLDTAKCEAKEVGEPLKETLCRLLIHGLLHLLNYDHESSPQDARRMKKEEARLLNIMLEE